MKSFIIIICLSVFTKIYGQDPRDTVYENTLFWEVTGNSLTAPSYLYGTHHICCDTEVVLDPVILEKLYSSKIFYLETLVTKGPVDSLILLSKTSGGIKDFLGNRDFRMTKRFLESYFDEVQESWLDTLSTQEVLYLIRRATLRCRNTSFDDSLYNLAFNHKLEIRGLETLEDAKKNLSPGMELTPGRGWLVYNIVHHHNLRNAYRMALRSYNLRNITSTYRQMAYTPDGEESPNKINLAIRNKAWLPQMMSSMKEGSTFFAFGSGHLAGWNGIISLLRQNGYTVTPVFYPPVN